MEEEKTIVVSHTAAKKLREKKPRTEAQQAATARLVEATKARREQAKLKKAEEEEAARKQLEEQERKAQEEAVAKAKVVVKPKRQYTRKPKAEERYEEEKRRAIAVGKIEDSESESDEESETEEPPKRIMKKANNVKRAIEAIDETIQKASANQYEHLLRKKGFL